MDNEYLVISLVISAGLGLIPASIAKRKGYSFGVLKSAQAAGDLVALSQRGRRTVRVRVGSNVAAGLSEMLRLLENAVA